MTKDLHCLRGAELDRESLKEPLTLPSSDLSHLGEAQVVADADCDFAEFCSKSQTVSSQLLPGLGDSDYPIPCLGCSKQRRRRVSER